MCGVRGTLRRLVSIMPDYVTIKLYAETRRLLRLIAAHSGEQMVQVMQRLCEAEYGTIHKTITEATPATKQQTAKDAPEGVPMRSNDGAGEEI